MGEGGGGANSLTWFVSTFKSIPLELHNTLSVLASFKKRQGAWKILCGNLKILGFLPQIFIKTMFRITKKQQGAGGKWQGTQKNDRALRSVVLA